MNLQELEERSGCPARLIRFLIGESVLPPPQGGRRFARYGDMHLRGLAIYRASKEEGVESLDVIRARVGGGDLTTVHVVSEGIEMRIREGVVRDADALVEAVRKLVAQANEGNGI